MEGSVGLAVLWQHEASIRDTIAACSDIQVIADRLVAKCFIERNREREIMEGYPARKQSKLLLEAVMTQVKLSSSKFKVFVSILEEQPSLKDLVAKLQEEYSECFSIISLQPYHFSPMVMQEIHRQA